MGLLLWMTNCSSRPPAGTPPSALHRHDFYHICTLWRIHRQRLCHFNNAGWISSILGYNLQPQKQSGKSHPYSGRIPVSLHPLIWIPSVLPQCTFCFIAFWFSRLTINYSVSGNQLTVSFVYWQKERSNVSRLHWCQCRSSLSNSVSLSHGGTQSK